MDRWIIILCLLMPFGTVSAELAWDKMSLATMPFEDDSDWLHCGLDTL